MFYKHAVPTGLKKGSVNVHSNAAYPAYPDNPKIL